MFRTQSKSRPAGQWLGVLLQTTLLAAPTVWAAPSTLPQNVNVVNTPLPVQGTVSVANGISIANTPSVNVPNGVAITNTSGDPVPAQIMLPSAPFAMEYASVTSSGVIVGPGAAQQLAVTAITLTNAQPDSQAVTIENVRTSLGNCMGTASVAGAPNSYVIVEAGHTLQLTYPTPVVYPEGCLRLKDVSGGWVYATVHGFSVAPQ